MGYNRYKPNIVYVLSIDSKYYYVGSESRNKEYLTPNMILTCSGNPLLKAYNLGIISHREYKERAILLTVDDYDSKEEALINEVKKIKEYKEKYGDLCINKALYGNSHTTKGMSHSQYSKTPTINGEPIVSIGVKDNSLYPNNAREALSKANKGIKHTERQKELISNKSKAFHMAASIEYHRQKDSGEFKGNWQEFLRINKGRRYA